MKNRTVLARLAALGMSIALCFGVVACGEKDDSSERRRTEKEAEEEDEKEEDVGFREAASHRQAHRGNEECGKVA